MQALQVMEEANKIVEDFSTPNYVLYGVLFLVEVGLCFWISLNM